MFQPLAFLALALFALAFVAFVVTFYQWRKLLSAKRRPSFRARDAALERVKIAALSMVAAPFFGCVLAFFLTGYVMTRAGAF